MSHVRDGRVACTMCYHELDLAHRTPVLTTHPLRTHDVLQCPHCGYLVTVPRAEQPLLH